MNVYIWERVEECTGRYHCEGGVVVFADNLDEARLLANSEKGCNIKHNEQPDDIRAVDGGKKIVYIMPDAGCC